MLKQCYLELSNGGFGLGYKVTGLPGGHQSSWGDIFQTTKALREDEACEEGYLPIIDWGSANFTIVDCDADYSIVTLYDGDFHEEEYSFEELMDHWVKGEIPNLVTGEFEQK